MKTKLRILHSDGTVEGRTLVVDEDPVTIPQEFSTIRVIGTGEEADYTVVEQGVFYVYYPNANELRVTVTVVPRPIEEV